MPAATRLAAVATHPIQYQCPLWKQLARHAGIQQFKAFFCSDLSIRGYIDPGFGTNVAWSGDLLQGYESKIFGSSSPSSPAFLGNAALLESLMHYRPDACLIGAYLPLVYLRVIRACNQRGIPVIIRAEATDRDRDRSAIGTIFRDSVLRRIYQRIDMFAAIGRNARDHYLRLGVPEDRIRFAPYCIDSESLSAQAQGCRRGALRSELSIGHDAFVVLFAGKLIPKKDPMLVLKALARTPKLAGRPVHVWYMGDGVLRGAIERFAEENCRGRFRIFGFVPQERLGRVYADADVLVLPSNTRETWGLVVNEALQFGLPCVVSDRVGCAPDLISPGLTGSVFRHGDQLDLLRSLEDIARRLSHSQGEIATACRDRASAYSSHAATQGIVDCVAAIASRRARPLVRE